LSLGNTTLALLIALLSSIGLLASLYSQFFEPKRSEVSFFPVGIRSDGLYFIASNGGNIPGVAHGANIATKSGEQLTCSFKQDSFDFGALVEPNSTHPLRCVFDGEAIQDASSLCEFGILVFDSNGLTPGFKGRWPHC
jgi:hypothetical protein